MSGRFLISSTAQPQLCARCRELVLVAWIGGLRVRVDPYPIEPAIEAIAIIAGRPTYTLHLRELYARVGGNLALPGPVLPAHVCHRPLRAAHQCRDADCSRTCQSDTDPPF